MDFGYSEEENAVGELARQILADRVTNEHLKQHEASGVAFDRELWRALAEANLLGSALPEAHGGSALGFLALGRLLQEVGRHVAPVPAYPVLVLGALPLARFGSAEQQARWLPGIARGETLLTAALLEVDAGDPRVPTTRAERAGEGFQLSGAKQLVPCAAEAERVLVPARDAAGGVSLFWVDPRAEGVALAAQRSSDGQPHARVELRGVRVAEADRLGAAQEGAAILAWLVERAVAARCLMQLGVTERALEMTAAYSRERVQFERPIGSFQAVHQRAADAYIQVEALRLSAQEAAWRLAQDLPAAAQVEVAKYWAAEGGHFAAYACQHLHGGIGIDTDYPLHRYFTWAIQLEHELGSARHQLDRIGRSIARHGLDPDAESSR